MRQTRGFTLIEVGAITAVLSVGAVIVMPQVQEARDEARKSRDSMHVRGILQACAIWGTNNRDQYPMPSRVDAIGATLPRPDGLQGRDLRLDTTGNILSMLIFNGFFPAELTVSPFETGNVEVFDDYQVANPQAAANPDKALWDPRYRGTPLDEWGGKVGGKAGEAGHNSYAHAMPKGARRPSWSNTFSAVEAVWGNRGPAYTLEGGQWKLVEGSPFGDASNTLKFYEGEDAWAGHVAFNDQHVEFLLQPDPESLIWTFKDIENELDRSRADNVFHAEHDDTRAPIDEHLAVVAGQDGRGAAKATGEDPGMGALDQRNNYLRPISKVVSKSESVREVQFWID